MIAFNSSSLFEKLFILRSKGNNIFLCPMTFFFLDLFFACIRVDIPIITPVTLHFRGWKLNMTFLHREKGMIFEVAGLDSAKALLPLAGEINWFDSLLLTCGWVRDEARCDRKGTLSASKISNWDQVLTSKFQIGIRRGKEQGKRAGHLSTVQQMGYVKAFLSLWGQVLEKPMIWR